MQYEGIIGYQHLISVKNIGIRLDYYTIEEPLKISFTGGDITVVFWGFFCFFRISHGYVSNTHLA